MVKQANTRYTPQKIKIFKNNFNFSKKNLLIFAIAFGLIGGYIAFKAFAATTSVTYSSALVPPISQA